MWTLNRGSQIFLKSRSQLQILGSKKGDMMQIPYWGQMILE
jgi:hypothetical protein